ncbi:MAG: FmdB family zinc ribbon protein [Burkholderiaceae bacterium]
MPIYAYRCSACGHAKDVLQKLSDAVLTTCPACHAETFSKQVTAAGFQLKGSGWYVTDFRGGSAGAKAADGSSAGAPSPASGEGTAGSAGGASAGAGEASSGTSASSGEGGASASASSGGCAASCACH